MLKRRIVIVDLVLVMSELMHFHVTVTDKVTIKLCLNHCCRIPCSDEGTGIYVEVTHSISQSRGKQALSPIPWRR